MNTLDIRVPRSQPFHHRYYHGVTSSSQVRKSSRHWRKNHQGLNYSKPRKSIQDGKHQTYALFLAFSTSLAASAESRCSFVSAANCLPKVVGSGFTSFEFKPLFPENATFVHAVDTRAKEQVEDEYPSLYSSTDLYVKIGYWVEYGESSLSEDVESP